MNQQEEVSKYEEEQCAKSIKPILIKAGFVIIFSLAILLSIHSNFFKKLSAENISYVQEIVRQSGSFAFLVFFAIAAVLVAIGFPRLALCACAGAIFGFWIGLVIIQFATLLGSFVPFISARIIRNPLVKKFGSRIEFIMNIMKKGGTMAVIVARQLPITGGILNLLLGLTPIKKRDFIAGTLLGTLPEAIPAVMLGNSFSYTSFENSLYSLLISIVLLILVWLIMGFVQKFFRKTENTIKM